MDSLVSWIYITLLFLGCHCLKPEQLSTRLKLLERRLDAEILLRRAEAEHNANELEIIREALENKTNDGYFENRIRLEPPCEQGKTDNLTLILREAFADEKLLNDRVRRNVADLETGMNDFVKNNTRIVTNVSLEVTSLKDQLEISNGKRLNCENVIKDLDERIETLTGKVNTMMDLMKLESSKSEIQDLYKQIGSLSEKVQTVVDFVVLQSNKFESCHELLKNGRKENGVYDIYPRGLATPIRVYCDQVTDGGGWTVFQRRQNGAVDFYRDWNDYKHGFGDVEGEFWLGNEHIRDLTRSDNHGLRIDMEDFDDTKKHANYAKFKIGSESENYKLFVEGYTGNASDSLSGHNNAPFSTKDRDNDSSGSHCSSEYKGAWWYTSCHSSNLNGLYQRGAHKSYADGVNWQAWRGYHYSLKFVEMKLR